MNLLLISLAAGFAYFGIDAAFMCQSSEPINDLPGRPCLAYLSGLNVADRRLAAPNGSSNLWLRHALALKFNYEVLNVHAH